MGSFEYVDDKIVLASARCSPHAIIGVTKKLSVAFLALHFIYPKVKWLYLSLMVNALNESPLYMMG